MKKNLFLAALVLLTIVTVAYVMWSTREPEYRTDISELSEDPKWSKLAEVKSELTAAEFEDKLKRYFVVGDVWKEELSLSADALYDKSGEQLYAFGQSEGVSRYWRTKEELGVRSGERALEGIKVTLDPGHIGGKCAKMEERWFVIGDSLPVMEGEMALLVAQLIKPQLEALGAIVTLTRGENKPVARFRSPHYQALAKAKVEALDLDPALTELYAEKMFYRTAEIRARAVKVNERFQPDLVVALHFNAEAWGDPNDPKLVTNNHFHILLNGAYTEGEVRKADQRYEMIERILEGTIDEEIELSASFVKAFQTETQLPPYQYEPNSRRAKPVDEEGYVWARNLLANRLFSCPTIFLEPYIMNSQEVFNRVQLGDYKGTKEVNGELRKSIFREYADAVVLGIEQYYTEQ